MNDSDDDFSKLEVQKMVVSQEAFKKFQDALANPKPATEALKRLLRRKDR